MTICIAAICADDNAIVVASDRMVSANFLALEFEHPDKKIDQMCGTCVGLSAGDALVTREFWGGAKERISAFQSPSIESIANAAKEQFVQIRRNRAEDMIMRPRGFGLDEFYMHGLIQRLPSDLAMMLDSQVQNARVPVDAIVTGIDADGAHIYGIGDPGISICYNRLGYHAVGSGQNHALLHLIATNHARSGTVNQTAFTVYESKKHAEVAQGVGQETDMLIITGEGTRAVSSDELKLLDDVYNRKRAPQLDEINRAIQELPFERTG